MSSDGFGICGHKNAYNFKVKNGKWVEDLIGMDLAKNPPNNPTLYTTEQREKLIPPSEMVDRSGGENVKMLSMKEITFKNKNGLPSHMLFEHLGAPGADRFMSVNAMTFTGGEGTGGIRCEDLLSEHPSDEAKKHLMIKPRVTKMTEKAKYDARQNALISSFKTTSGASGNRSNKEDFKVRAADARPGMPVFGKRRLCIG
ncbi:hypothetical protein TrRE_jg8132 [Triparma retinervis]|uniref:Uncharacterized protein n=1 Tax=Triparma retinervis TaxID=2557542 RepID=A0A9W6ZN62_9STRA|nr:hypothetical protein TrRE_jg8132 [Triparma retinervis]